MGRTRVVAAVAGLACAAVLVGCSGSDGGGTATTTTTPTTMAVPATAPSSVPATTTTTTGSVASSSSVNTLPVLVPGQPCSPGSDPDCIDPDGTGDYVYLIGGAACMAGPIGGSMCADLDGDGYAGYPDAG